jgi:hypothetical protein
VTVSARGSRAKGVRGEREISKLFEERGFDVRGLEGQGDHIATKTLGDKLIALGLECKRQERLKIPEWWRQCAAETPDGMTPLLCFRQSGQQWMAVLLVEALLDLLERDA